MRKHKVHANTLRMGTLVVVALMCAADAQAQSRIESITYDDNPAKWMLGRIAARGFDATAAERYEYDPASGLLTKKWLFERLDRTFAYHPDGTVASVSDGAGNTTEYRSWKRGLPQSIKYADQAERLIEVSDDGWITGVIDEDGHASSYAYDGMGRMVSYTPPSGDTVDWLNTTAVFQPIDVEEHGIAPGHWRQTVTTGNEVRVSYFNALFKPLLIWHYDTQRVQETQRYTRFTYDSLGRLEFSSYPASTADATTGSWNEYDWLGRTTSVSKDSEHGLLVTTTSYLGGPTGPQTVTTLPGGPQIKTSFQAFGKPSYDVPTRIEAPEGAVTAIERDVFGKPMSITRSDAARGLSVARAYVYNVHQQLCKTVEPESGATVMGYDAAGNLAWSASGLAMPALDSCDTSAAHGSGRRIDRTYDSRNRVSALVLPDGLGNQVWEYTATGRPAAVLTSNQSGVQAQNVYLYNKRGLITAESLNLGDGETWAMGYGYDNQGALSALRYPSGMEISLAPNGLGQPTRVGDYAFNATYYPNGLLRGFSYGNGILHSISQNERGAISRLSYAGVADDTIEYDLRGNVAAIYDSIESSRSRTMEYDSADRLITAVSPSFGGDGVYRYTYDALDNLRSAKIAAVKQHNYSYDVNNRMTTVNEDDGAAIIGVAYDVQGNLALKNGQSFVFDFGNRLREAAGIESYAYDANGRRVANFSASEGDILSFYGHDGALVRQHDKRTGREIEYISLAGHVVAEVATSSSTTPCNVPPTRTETSNQTATCPAGTLTSAGAPTFLQAQSRLVTYSCPDVNGSPVASPGAWSEWAPTIAETCAVACSAPAPTETPITREAPAEVQEVGCPAGQEGSHTQQRARVEAGVSTLSWTCPTPTGAAQSTIVESWSGNLVPAGDWVNTGNTCATPSGPPAGTLVWECAFGSDADYPFCRIEFMMNSTFWGQASIDHWTEQSEYSESAIINVPVTSCASGKASALAYVTYGRAECL